MIGRLRCRAQSALPIMLAILPSFHGAVPHKPRLVKRAALRRGLSKSLGWEPQRALERVSPGLWPTLPNRKTGDVRIAGHTD
jgi:hypothetical protein